MFSSIRRSLFLTVALTVAAAIAAGSVPAAAQSEVEELRKELAAIREEVQKLKDEMAAKEEEPEEPDRLTEIERRIEILAEEVERSKMGDNVFRRAEKSEHGLGVAASKVYQAEQGLSIGGYGEMLFESFSSERDDGAAAGESDQLDFLRGIVYVGYKFNDRWLFNSEIEFEHAATDKEGSVSVEFAYLDYLRRPELNFRIGMVLVPMGFVNELHEPPLFLGARRPDVESRIIPSTWRENGVGLFGDVGPFTYRTYLVNGLRGAGFSSNGIRGGRQKGSKALAEDFAWTGRLDYTGTPGILVGASAYIGDSGQGVRDPNGQVVKARTTLYEAHLEWKRRGFELRALAARGEIDDVARLNAALGLTGSSSIGEEFEGAYVQLGYDVFAPLSKGEKALIPYARWESFDTQAAVPDGFLRNPARDREILTLGLAFKPFDQITLKADFQDIDNEADSGVDQFNFAVGYLF